VNQPAIDWAWVHAASRLRRAAPGLGITITPQCSPRTPAIPARNRNEAPNQPEMVGRRKMLSEAAQTPAIFTSGGRAHQPLLDPGWRRPASLAGATAVVAKLSICDFPLTTSQIMFRLFRPGRNHPGMMPLILHTPQAAEKFPQAIAL